MNQGVWLVNTFQTLSTLVHLKRTAGRSFAAAEIKTGAPHKFVPVSKTSANPYRIKQDYLLPMAPTDKAEDESPSLRHVGTDRTTGDTRQEQACRGHQG